MESHPKKQGRWRLRAAGTGTLIVIAFLTLTCGNTTFGQPQAEVNEPVAPSAKPAEQENTFEKQMNDLNNRREELARQARQQAQEARELRENRSAQEERVAGELRHTLEQMRGVERDLLGLQRQCEERTQRQMARESDRARGLAEQIEKLRAQTDEVRLHIERLNEENRRRTERIQTVLEQTRRQICILEERLGMTEHREQPSRPGEWEEPEEQIRVRPLEPRTEPSGGLTPPMRRMPFRPEQPIMELQEQVGQLRQEVHATGQKVDDLERRIGWAQPNHLVQEDLSQLQKQIASIQEQVQQTQLLVERRLCDNPYTIGNVGGRWYPNYGW
jgi:DNA repair exonuclease SbcCD ATPase subunit